MQPGVSGLREERRKERGKKGGRERGGGRGREGREMNRTMRKYRLIGLVNTG